MAAKAARGGTPRPTPVLAKAPTTCRKNSNAPVKYRIVKSFNDNNNCADKEV
jgi:hypothetical protein